MYALIPLAGFVFGFVLGRWWSLIAVVPLWAWIVATSEIDGSVTVWVASVLSVLLACAIAAGVALRRLQRRRSLGA